MKADDISTVEYSWKHFDHDLIEITFSIPWLSRAVQGHGIAGAIKFQKAIIYQVSQATILTGFELCERLRAE